LRSMPAIRALLVPAPIKPKEITAACCIQVNILALNGN
jgi:hypothetical protein